MMDNPWKDINLRKTGLNEERLKMEIVGIDNLESRQSSLQQLASENTSKIYEFTERQGSLAVDAMLGQQGREIEELKRKQRDRKI